MWNGEYTRSMNHGFLRTCLFPFLLATFSVSVLICHTMLLQSVFCVSTWLLNWIYLCFFFFFLFFFKIFGYPSYRKKKKNSYVWWVKEGEKWFFYYDFFAFGQILIFIWVEISIVSWTFLQNSDPVFIFLFFGPCEIGLIEKLIKFQDLSISDWYWGEDCVAFVLDIVLPFYFGSLMHCLFCVISGFGEF